ncbi:uncharacterized protein RSE6_03759 [Rhynchosporium secalis]|uniref:Uncharacterized protein n=1 Tax=Rhynchosporium secalis TaxID=38038 RepID=A0A1E1M3K6_RHYSE|nr:uncharacterized protein RSE6_03759 [Rhynchosporium secalis]
MTLAHVKIIHAQVQSRLVKESMATRASRSPVTVGELCDAFFRPCPGGLEIHQQVPIPGVNETSSGFVPWKKSDDTISVTSTPGSTTDSRPMECSRSTREDYQQSSYDNNGMATISDVETHPKVPHPVSLCDMSYSDSAIPALPSAVAYGESLLSYRDIHAYEDNRYLMNPDAQSFVPHGMVTIGHPMHHGPHPSVPHGMVPMGSLINPDAYPFVPHGTASYPTVPVGVVSDAIDFGPTMAPAPYFSHSKPLPQRSQTTHSREECVVRIGTARVANVDRLSSYKGDVTEETVRNTQCPDELNSSLQNEGFPISTSTIDVLSVMKFAAVRNIGIHPAIEGVFPSVAADITFFTREAAEY